MGPTTAEMVLAAETASEVADADEAVAWRKLVEASGPAVRSARAEWVIAHAAASYARNVLVAVRFDHHSSCRQTA